MASRVIFSIAPLAHDEISTMADFIYNLAEAQAMNRFLFKSWAGKDEQIQYRVRMWENELKKYPETELYKAVCSDGEVLAFLALRQIKQEEDELEEEKPGQDEDKNTEAKNFENVINTEFRKYQIEQLMPLNAEVEKTDNYVIEHISVKRSHRKFGIGSALIEFSKEKAKAAGVPLALISVPAAHPFYQRVGFRDTLHTDVDLSKFGAPYSGYGIYRCYGMVLD